MCNVQPAKKSCSRPVVHHALPRRGPQDESILPTPREKRGECTIFLSNHEDNCVTPQVFRQSLRLVCRCRHFRSLLPFSTSCRRTNRYNRCATMLSVSNNLRQLLRKPGPPKNGSEAIDRSRPFLGLAMHGPWSPQHHKRSKPRIHNGIKATCIRLPSVY